MNIFQVPYNWLKKLSFPAWIKSLIQELNDILVSILIQVGKDYKDFIIEKILEASKMNVTNEKKFKYVFDEAKKGFITFGVTLKDSQLNALLEFIYSKLHIQGVV